MSSTPVAVLAIIATAGLAVLAAGCGGSPRSNVAQLGATTTNAAAPTQANGVVAFSRCVRAHGVPAYPDPGSNELIPKEPPQQLGVSPSVLEAAQKACIHLVPNGGKPTPTQVAQYRSAMLSYARCVRTHGVPNMPDPDSRGHLDIGPGTGVDVNSPKFEAAYQACKSKLSP